VQFVTRVRGWLLAVQPTAPIENLEATTDGGSSWQVVASSRQAPGIGLLPELGQVEFGPDGSGWLGGGMFSNALYRTGDGGRTWRRARIPAPSGSMFGLPAAYGSTVIEPVTAGHELLLFRSADGGLRWAAVGTDWRVPGGCASPEIQATNADHAWVLLAATGHVYATSTGGRTWRQIDAAAAAAALAGRPKN
jgi:photosystem II stability/assembly factor-like uncharacterized protein